MEPSSLRVEVRLRKSYQPIVRAGDQSLRGGPFFNTPNVLGAYMKKPARSCLIILILSTVWAFQPIQRFPFSFWLWQARRGQQTSVNCVKPSHFVWRAGAKMIEIENSHPGLVPCLCVFTWINPSKSYYISLFINGRYIKNFLLNRAISLMVTEAAYGSALISWLPPHIHMTLPSWSRIQPNAAWFKERQLMAPEAIS